MFFMLNFLFLIHIFSVIGQNLEKSRSVWVEQGLVRGKIYKIGDQQVQIFRGVPYADPPLGSLRFRKSVKKSRWEREYAAIDYGPPCIQFMDFHKNDRFSGDNMQRESEDCLYLNIFSPYDSTDESRLYPIIVWIHGGSFLAGSADTGIDMETVSKNVVFKGVTLVTINYRLGPLGFMSINYGDKIEGNFGIWDIKLSLEWIQRNIKQFNGDPNKVTIMGESAGAAAVSLLALSPLTQGLVHQAIAMSGSSTAGWAIHRHGNPQWDMANIAEYVRCNKVMSDEDLDDILNRESVEERDKEREHCNLQDSLPDCLINGGQLSTEEMLECFQNEVNFSNPLFRKALSSELGVSKMIVDNDLVPESGYELIAHNARIPIMTGVARREWAHKKPEFYQFVRYENVSKEQCEESVRKIVESAYVQGLPMKLPNSTIDLISNATYMRYMNDIDFSYEMPEVVYRLQSLESDVEFVAPCQREINAYVERGVDVFAYTFDYMPKGTIIEEEKRYYGLFGDTTITVRRSEQANEGNKLGAFHGLDHAFIFSQGYSSNFYIEPFSKRDKSMSRMLNNMITNFAIKGNPSTENFEWPKYTNSSARHVSIDLPPKVLKSAVHFPAPIFWNSEVDMFTKYMLTERKPEDEVVSELTLEERIQLNAYRRAWWALWLLVVAIGVLIWGCVICFVFHKRHSPTAKTYDNIVVNR
uniref:Carboxylesterase type B domain-containing protein n=1 Tax=Acrobeloides nanus TaxID=290746 RepID=A0A914BVG4_9BILA